MVSNLFPSQCPGCWAIWGDKQCHQDDGVKQTGFLACRKHNTAVPVLLPEVEPEVGWLCPHRTKPKPISSHRAGWDMRVLPPETEKRDSGCLQCGSIGVWTLHPGSSSSSCWHASSLGCATGPAPKGFISWSREPALGPLAHCHHSHPVSSKTRVLGR